MDTILRYGVGIVLLGLGNVAVGVTQWAFGGQSTVVAGIELVVGMLLFGFGYAAVTDPDRIDTEQTSLRVLAVVGYVGIALGVGMLVWSAFVAVSAF